MKSKAMINAIIANMPDERFEKINKATYDYQDLDPRVSRNAYKRMVYNLHKVGLTLHEWFMWCDWE